MADGRCTGDGDARGDHCCWLEGEPCPALEENVDGRRYACGLRRRLGSWEAVYDDPWYQEYVQPVLNRHGIESCGAWGPGSGQCCYRETEVTIGNTDPAST